MPSLDPQLARLEEGVQVRTRWYHRWRQGKRDTLSSATHMVIVGVVVHVMSRYVRVGAILPSGRLFRASEDVVKGLVMAGQTSVNVTALSCAWAGWR